MGQKGSPTGFRLVTRKKWLSNWYANKQEFGDFLAEDRKIRKFLMKQPACVGTSRLTIKRTSGKIELIIHTARPGLVIGKKGAEIDLLKNATSYGLINLIKNKIYEENITNLISRVTVRLKFIWDDDT